VSAVDPAKLEKYRERLREESTEQATESAWRKWQAPLAAFARGATEAVLEAAQLRPGLRLLDLASGVGDPALFVAEAGAPSGLARGLRHIEFRITDVESLPFPDEFFDDVVTCRCGIMFRKS